jgi:hypothetical protein
MASVVRGEERKRLGLAGVPTDTREGDRFMDKAFRP